MNQINVGARVKGEWAFRAIDPVTRETNWETGFFPNLVTDIGLDRMGSGATLLQYCRIGTGTAAAATTDTALQSQSASTSTIVSTSSANAGSPNYESTSTSVYEFALGDVVGNMAEIGCGWSISTASTLFSRARINDAGGSPTTITVLATEILQATYRFTVYPKTTDDTGSVTIGGVSYNYTARRSLIGTTNAIAGVQPWPVTSILSPTVYSGAIGAITDSPSGTNSGLTVGSFSAYTNGTYFRDFSVSATISQGNIGGIKSLSVACFNGSSCQYETQMEFNNVIPKDGTKTFSLTCRFSWARYP